MNCVFCAIVAGQAPATFIRRWPHASAFVPLNPVTPGHTLVVPHQHVPDAAADPAVAGQAMTAAAELASELAGELPDFNILTSKGTAATQTVFHLHLHLVPRRTGDGLPLPWTPQHEEVQR